MKKIVIGNDHAGVGLKNTLSNFLKKEGYEVLNIGTDSIESVDYPDFAHKVSNVIENGEADLGILICGSGQGMAISANKHQKVRAAVCWIPEIAALARQHNNANVLCLPARFISEENANQIALVFLQSGFEGGRHQTRIDKITSYCS